MIVGTAVPFGIVGGDVVGWVMPLLVCLLFITASKRFTACSFVARRAKVGPIRMARTRPVKAHAVEYVATLG